MSKEDGFARLDALAQAELVRKKEVQPIELVEAAIDRIERLNPQLNAVVTPMYDLAREAALGALPDGPFTGVPFLLKDLMAAYGSVRLTSGSRMLKDYVPPEDNEIVRRFKRAGLIVLGKTNTPEFGFVPLTEPLLFGPAHNPWNLDRTTAGSSGGSAAAVAAGLTPMAHGNDGGGSIRMPSSCCGVFGFKATRTRTPLGPDIFMDPGGLAIEGVITRSVRDSAAVLDAIAGPDIGDSGAAPPQTRPYLQEVGVRPGRLRIAAITSAGADLTVHPDCIQAVQETAALCADLGHEVEEAAPGIDLFPAETTMLYWGYPAWEIDRWAKIAGVTPSQENLEPHTWMVYQFSKELKAVDFLLAETAAQQLARSIGRFLTRYDLLLSPTLAAPPMPIGAFALPQDNLEMGKWMCFTPLANLTGQPAMSVPLFWNQENLPVGVQFVGRFGDEATLFRLAAQLEEARPWADRRPVVSA